MGLHRAAATFDAKDDAVAWLSAERRLIELDAWTPPADRVAVKKATGKTLRDFSEDWLENRRTKRGPIKPRTKADYRRLLDRHILPVLGDVPLRNISSDRINAWYDALDPGTPTERAHAYQLLRAIFTTASDAKVRAVPRNPCQVDGGGQVSRAHKVRTATLDELSTIVENMPERLRLAVLLGAWCALRYGEVAELRRRDVDLRRGLVDVSRGVTWPDGRPTVGAPKTDAGRREIHIPPHILPIVKSHLAEHTGPQPDALLFPASSGGHLHPRTFGKRFDAARAAANRTDLHFHDLRHTGAVLAAQTGATLAELMARLGHSTPGAAMRYQHAASDRDRAIAEALSRMVR
ncbi:MAG: tyrosine-type recombinase/integrase [Propionibacteriaceae bacterium]